MRFEVNGRVIHLTYHTLQEWADAVEKSFLKLGCSEEYARAAGDRYREEVGGQEA